MSFNYLTLRFYISLALTAISLINDELTAIVFALITISFAILLHGAMKNE